MSRILQELLLEDDATHTPTGLAKAAKIPVTAHQSLGKEAENFSFPEHTPLGFSEETKQNFGNNMQHCPEGCKQAREYLDTLTNNPDTEELNQEQRNMP